MTVTPSLVLFWTNQDSFSNWYPAAFTVKDVAFNCTEQYMMYAKAMLFGDADTAARVLQTADPRQQKALGREVKGFDDAVWTAQRERVMYVGCLAKFSQNPRLAEALLATGERDIAEASPYDRIWGIGLAASDPRAQNPATWQGLNLLGRTLVRVRDALKVRQALPTQGALL